MANQEFDQKVRRIMILQKQQELFYAQGKWDECKQLLEQIKDTAEDILDIDEMSLLDTTTVYMMMINTVSKAYMDLHCYREAGDTIFDAMLEAQPLIENKHEPKSATLLCDLLMSAVMNLNQAFSEPPVDECNQDSLYNLMSILADLFVQSYDNLCRVSPDYPLTEVLRQLNDLLKSQGLVGLSDCRLDELVESTYMMIIHWQNICDLIESE